MSHLHTYEYLWSCTKYLSCQEVFNFPWHIIDNNDNSDDKLSIHRKTDKTEKTDKR